MSFKVEYLNESGDVVSTAVVDELNDEMTDKVLNVMQWPAGHPKRVVDFNIIEGTYAAHPTTRGAVIFTPA